MKYFFVSYSLYKKSFYASGRVFLRTSEPFLHVPSLEADLSKIDDAQCVVLHYKEISEEEYAFQIKER